MHNIVCDNCHSHVALVLNHLKYQGRSDWNQVRLFAALWAHGKWVHPSQRVFVFLPFLILLTVVVVVILVSVLVPR